MTGVDWPSFLIQLPIVAAFIWYSLELQKRYQQSMDGRDKAYLEALAKITNSLDCHDEKVASQIDAAKKEAEGIVHKAADLAAQKVLADAALTKSRLEKQPRSQRVE
jgi:hypothetical protein